MKQTFLLTLALLNTPMGAMLNEKYKNPLKKITKSFKMRNQLQLEKSNLLHENCKKIALDACEGRDLYLALKASETAFCSRDIISQNIKDAANKIAKLDNQGLRGFGILYINFNFLLYTITQLAKTGSSLYGHFSFLLTAGLIGGNEYISHIQQEVKTLARYTSKQKDDEQALNLIENYKNQLCNYYGPVLINWPNNPLKVNFHGLKAVAS